MSKPATRSRSGPPRRALRLLAAGLLSWGVLAGGVWAIILVRDHEEAAARLPLRVEQVALSPSQRRAWTTFPDFHGVIPVLAYHGIGAKPSYLTVSRHLFARQMLALHTAGFHTVTLQQYVRYNRTGSTAGLPSRPILLTFDDGRVDSYRGADEVLARYHYTAVMFVVAAWPDSNPTWSLHWNELVRMEQSGRWQIQEHAGRGHTHVPIDAKGDTGEFYAYREWKQGHLESFAAYKARVVSDVLWGEKELRSHIPGYEPLAFAIPYSNYGQRYTNDIAVPRFFLEFLHTRFPIVVDGDYLDEGKHRPAEIHGRWSKRLTYRITQGPVMGLTDLRCRLRDNVLRAPIWHEYACLRHGHLHVPSARSD